MRCVSFVKYEGLGNDFILVNTDGAFSLTEDDVRKVCDRHFGIGADGVIFVSAADDADATMIVRNADGSRPEMCGNGLRCVALHLALARPADAKRFVVRTDAGLLGCTVSRTGSVATVTSTAGTGVVGESSTRIFGGVPREFLQVSIGNPHLVAFGFDADAQTIDRDAPLLSAGVAGGSNVEIANMRGDGRIELVVWERGVGRTLACGTGAAATAVAAAVRGLAAFDRDVVIALPGGELVARVERESLSVTLVGPARRVFVGEFEA